MKKKIIWLAASCSIVVALLLASCGPTVTEEEEAAPPEEKEVVTAGKEAAPPEGEEVVTEDVVEEDATEEEEKAPPPEIVWYTENNLLIKHPIYSGENLGDDIVYRYFEVLGASGEIEINVRTRDLRYDSTVEGTRAFFVEEGNKYRLSIHFSGLWDWNPLETHIGDVVVSNPPPSRFEVIVSSPSAPSPDNLTLMDVYAPSWTSLCIKEMAMEKLQGVEVISDYNYEDNCYVTHYELGKPIKTVGHRPDGTEFTKSTYNYDNSGRLIEVNGETVEGKETKTTVEWDGLILRSSLSQSKDPDGDWNQGTKTTYESARRVRSDDLDTGWHSEF